jgi:hypothetical protein
MLQARVKKQLHGLQRPSARRKHNLGIILQKAYKKKKTKKRDVAKK